MSKDIRELVNPHDDIVLDCSDMEAAQTAVLVVGQGAYGIDGDDGLPILLMGGHEEWTMERYGVGFSEWFGTVSRERVATALESFALRGERSSMSDPVGMAHSIAADVHKQVE